MSSSSVQSFITDYSQIAYDWVVQEFSQLKSNSTDTSFAITGIAMECILTYTLLYSSDLDRKELTVGVFFTLDAQCERKRYLLSLQTDDIIEKTLIEELSKFTPSSPVFPDPQYQADLDFVMNGNEEKLLQLITDDSFDLFMERVLFKYCSLFITIFHESQKTNATDFNKSLFRFALNFCVKDVKKAVDRENELKTNLVKHSKELFSDIESTIEAAKREQPLADVIATDLKIKSVVTFEGKDQKNVFTHLGSYPY